MANLSSIPREEYNIDDAWVKRGEFKYPDARVSVDPGAFKIFYYWIHERQEIWYKRNILKAEAPWTEDEIFQRFRFTHPIRDIDKVSIFYRDNILSRLEDTEQSKKNLLLNTVAFRIFNKPDVWEKIGYLDPQSDDVLGQLQAAQRRVIRYGNEGNYLFTGAFIVNPMMNVRRYYGITKKSKNAKVENAFLVIRYVYENLDDLYARAVSGAPDMKSQIKAFNTVPGIGNFNSYEWACDLCMAERYTDIPVVKWDDNSDTNIGPGAKRGLDYIFTDYGNLNHKQALLVLAAIAEYVFKALGYDKTMKWPEEVTEFNLRVVEHSLVA